MSLEHIRNARRHGRTAHSAGIIEALEERRLMAATASVSVVSSTMESGTLQFRATVITDYYPTPTTVRTFYVGLDLAGTADHGSDYYFPSPSSVTIVLPPYATTGSGTLSIETRRDNSVEGSETVIASVGSLTGPGAGSVSSPPPSATATIGDDPPRVSIEGTHGPLAEYDGTTTLTARRTGGDPTMRLFASLQTSGAADGSDYSVPASIMFEYNESSVLVPVTLKNDAATESPKGNPGWSEQAIVSVAPGGTSYVADTRTATLAFQDDSTWFFTPWKERFKPDPMRGQWQYLGEREETWGLFDGMKRVTKYHWYDQWVAQGSGQESFDYGVDIEDYSVSWSWGEAYSWGQNFTLTAGGEPVSMSWSLYHENQFQSGGGTTVRLPVQAADEDEKAWIVPLMEKRNILAEYINYEWRYGAWHEISRGENTEVFNTGNVNYAAFEHERVWIDPEAVTNQLPTEPENNTNGLLP